MSSVLGLISVTEKKGGSTEAGLQAGTPILVGHVEGADQVEACFMESAVCLTSIAFYGSCEFQALRFINVVVSWSTLT